MTKSLATFKNLFSLTLIKIFNKQENNFQIINNLKRKETCRK